MKPVVHSCAAFSLPSRLQSPRDGISYAILPNMNDGMGCFTSNHELYINLWNLVVVVRDFVLLDEAVSYVFQSLTSKSINME